jgi:cytochrome c biogenesis protein CcmG, thiol:disulfide interchange protein DsbE
MKTYFGSRTIATALFCAGSLAACTNGSSGKNAQAAIVPAHVGKPAPDWSEPAEPKGTLSLHSLRGKPVYLNLFATWCAPCNDEAPAINALQERYASKGLQVVGVDILESARKAEQFRTEHHLAYPAVVDDGTVRGQYNVNGLPVHVFIDRQGVVRNIVVGEMSPDEMQANIERIVR